MTDREKAIIMAYTGVATLVGEKLDEFYKYLAELYGRPVYTHELLWLDIKEKSKLDFVKLCQKEDCSQDNDSISRKAAVDALKEVSEHYTDKGREWHPHVDFMVQAIEELPSAQPEPQWIPVTDGPPKKSGRYIVTRGLNASPTLRACAASWNRVYVLNYSDLMGLNNEKIWWDGNVGKSDFTKYEDVVAWMPLPKPWV